MKLPKIKQKIKKALDNLYNELPCLIEKGLCEKCINHRFTVYLEKEKFGKEYFVDCEYNKTHLVSLSGSKKVSSRYGNYIDIAITQRAGTGGDLICFEVKKWNNYNGRGKDRENLKVLIGQKPSVNGKRFNYDYGFFIIFGKTKEKTKIEIYQKNKDVKKISYQDL